VGVTAALALAAGVAVAGAAATSADDAHDHGPSGGAPAVEILTERSSSPDDISAQLRLKLDGAGRTHVMNMADVDQVQLAALTFGPGDLVDWHTHPGPVLVIVDEGVLTVTTARDCVARDYGPGETYIEQGPGDVLKVANETHEDTVIYALFFELPAAGPLTNFEAAPDC
jgi:quercetin dioxygenase-like cupin family protein